MIGPCRVDFSKILHIHEVHSPRHSIIERQGWFVGLKTGFEVQYAMLGLGFDATLDDLAVVGMTTYEAAQV